MNKNKISELENFYNNIDYKNKYTLINKCKKEENFRNFVYKCKDININLFKNNKNKWKFKTKRQLLT